MFLYRYKILLNALTHMQSLSFLFHVALETNMSAKLYNKQSCINHFMLKEIPLSLV